MKGTASKVLEKIKKENIRPTPKSFFLTKRVLIAGIILFAIFLAFLCLNGTIFDIVEGMESKNLPNNIFYTIPFLWLIVLIATIYFGCKLFGKTKTGYKYNKKLIFGTSIGIFLITSFFSYLSGIYSSVYSINEKMPFYESMSLRHEFWSRAEEGLIAGEIIEKNGNILILKDLEGQIWSVDIGKASNQDHVDLIKGNKIRLFGKKQDNSNFLAIELRVWCNCCKMKKDKDKKCMMNE
ncbi:MAG: hypothetical protein PHF46_03055 [Candidatus Gracilibacteria bacterium]|nr:hypothetical protein [Candidatus Gracilibacteria bacterium]MDD3120361.1 hypothetical protein [Candidatus Gracilibacteria bacterium]MDD4530735.1 hypothetical protein [Candidatus Gracilibacteria bacterium]